MSQDMKNPALAPLAALVGTWTMASPQFPGESGSVTFAWLDGGAFLVQRTEFVNAIPPTATTIIGRDEAIETYSMLYFDSRGVSRIYQMSFDDGVWKLWRAAPGFHQRFTGTFSEDGTTIAASWESSSDGSVWAHDFDLIYTRVS
jgi:hypothetical protein